MHPFHKNNLVSAKTIVSNLKFLHHNNIVEDEVVDVNIYQSLTQEHYIK